MPADNSQCDFYDLISWQKVEELEQALQSGSDPNKLDQYGNTPPFRVVYNPTKHQVRMLELLIQYGADVNYRNQYGRTVILGAGSVEIAEILLKNGADISIISSEGCTPLHYATSAEMAQFFIDKGIDVNARDNDGSTAIFDAVYEGPDLVDCLLRNGAAADARNNGGQTPLMRLADNDYADTYDADELRQIAESLIQHGADVDAVDNEGKSAIDCANRARNTVLAKFLESVRRK